MTPNGQTVCLCMIVKDEAHVIARCLASVRPILDHWIVVDTGSTDGTQAVVRAAMAGLPGEIVERPWLDFAHNRSEALALARPHADYSFVIDADDELVLPPDFAMPPLDADSHTIDIHYGATTYQRPQLVRNALEWRYRGVVHEFLECAAATTTGHVPIVMKINHEGSRSTDPATYAKDAAILERALAGESDPFLVSRYTFYLAQSFRDCGEREKALEAYLRRAELGYWVEEVFVSLLNAGRLMEGLGHDADATLAVYARATQAAPFRAEAAHAASSLCRRLSRFAEGYAIAAPARALQAPPSGLFVEPWSYEYGLCDELAVNAYWAGHYRECLDATLQALQSGKVPEGDRPRYLANMRFALDRLPGSNGSPPPVHTLVPCSNAAPCAATGAPADVDIATLLACREHAISIVDIGAAQFGEKQFYQPLLDRGLGRLTCFEPDPARYGEMTEMANGRDAVLNTALGDGAVHPLHLAPGGMTSIFRPDQASYDLYELFAAPPFSPIEASLRQTSIDTTRLDDVVAVERIDLVKIDTQGAELMILRNGRDKLRDCSIVQIEVPFVRLYRDQPSYGDIEAELRAQGFMVHGFATLKRLPLQPYGVAGPLIGINQLVDLDMIFIRDMRRMRHIPSQMLRTTAVLADICYSSFDLALRCLTELARRRLIEPGLPERYAQASVGRRPVGVVHHTPYVA